MCTTANQDAACLQGLTACLSPRLVHKHVLSQVKQTDLDFFGVMGVSSMLVRLSSLVLSMPVPPPAPASACCTASQPWSCSCSTLCSRQPLAWPLQLLVVAHVLGGHSSITCSMPAVPEQRAYHGIGLGPGQ